MICTLLEAANYVNRVLDAEVYLLADAHDRLPHFQTISFVIPVRNGDNALQRKHESTVRSEESRD